MCALGTSLTYSYLVLLHCSHVYFYVCCSSVVDVSVYACAVVPYRLVFPFSRLRDVSVLHVRLHMRVGMACLLHLIYFDVRGVACLAYLSDGTSVIGVTYSSYCT